jgi:hypothetical protein
LSYNPCSPYLNQASIIEDTHSNIYHVTLAVDNGGNNSTCTWPKEKKTIKKNKLQNTTKITKDCATLHPVKSGG